MSSEGSRSGLPPNKTSELRSAEEMHRRVIEEGEPAKPFGTQWPSASWAKWALIHFAFRTLGIERGSTVLDVGCGTGWTTLLLAEAGYVPTGVDLAPAMVDVATRHARRWSSSATFEVGDMEQLDLERRFDAALVFDALHHLVDPGVALDQIARHLQPRGWLLIGEPSRLHLVSPSARRATRERGWVENGFTIRELKQLCRRAGLGEFRRLFEGTQPYGTRIRGFAWELVRLASANVFYAPGCSIWLAAQKTGSPIA